MRNPKLSDEEVMDEIEGRMRNKGENAIRTRMMPGCQSTGGALP
jgi:hypothetical protein